MCSANNSFRLIVRCDVANFSDSMYCMLTVRQNDPSCQDRRLITAVCLSVCVSSFHVYYCIYVCVSLCVGLCVLLSIYAFVCSTCSHGRWQCTADSCSQTCSVIGLQHFQTFDGQTYQFHGPPCSYILVEVRFDNHLELLQF